MDLAPPSERKRTPGEFHQVQNPETNDIDKMMGGKWRLAIGLSGIKTGFALDQVSGALC